MITQRINQWDYEDEALAESICERYKMQGKKAWVRGTTVYWVEESTD
jgi:hypothetical protein